MRRLSTWGILVLALMWAPTDVVAQNWLLLSQRQDIDDTLHASSQSLDRPARVDFEGITPAQALQSLRERTGVRMVYSPSLLPDDVSVVCECRDLSILETLDRILDGTGFEFTTFGAHVVVERTDLPPGATSLAGVAGFPEIQPLRPVRVRMPASRSLRGPQGTITGSVRHGESGEPLSGVQVHIPELSIGVLSVVDGSFVLENVPAGEHTVAAQLLGYRQVTRTVTVASGQTVDIQFELHPDALALDELVITGTPGGTQRRAIGNVVGRIGAAEVTALTPISSMEDLLRGREPGLSFNRSSGNVGAGSEIRIRGTSTFNLGDTPLIYVDGIRVDNTTGVGPGVADGRQATRLDDLNPEEVESIEIIKGPAAATLYGTEASAGVIQIITKSGGVGPAQFEVMVRQGSNWLPNPAAWTANQVGVDPETGDLIRMNIYEAEAAAGRPFFQTGLNQKYTASMRGGTEAVRYFLSVDWQDDEGIVDYNWDERVSLRGNVSLLPHETVSLDLSSGYVTGETSFAQQRSSWGVFESAVWARPADRDTPQRGFHLATPEQMELMESTRDYRRFTGSATVSHTPVAWLTHRLTVGLDDSFDENRMLVPRQPEAPNHIFGALSLGEIEVERPNVRTTTLDYAASGIFSATPNLDLTTSLGFQYYGRRVDDVRTLGRVFPSPQIRNLAGVQESEVDEFQTENKSVGFYVQEELNYRDRLFLTAAVRGDDNSAFGTDFDAAIYPKVSAAWVVTDEDFWAWDNVVNSLRLRSSWGKAGRQPDTFAAVTLYSPEPGAGGASGIEPNVRGNPDVGPEVSTELEVGFDAALLEDRVTAEFTYYTQTVEDALLSRTLAPSGGFPGAQSANLGQLSNWGWELQVNGRVLDRPSYALDLGVGLNRNRNRIDDMGGRPESATIREGWPYPVLARRVILSAEWVDEVGGLVTNVLCDGGTEDLRPGGDPVPCLDAPRLLIGTRRPEYEWGFNGMLTLFDDLRITALVEMRRNFWLGSFLYSCRHWCFPNAEQQFVNEDPIYAAAHQGYLNFQGNLVNHDYRAGFAKLRELGLTYSLPTSLADRMGASRASVSVAGRNLWTIWQAQSDIRGIEITDPEIVGLSGNASIAPIPPLTSFSVTLRASF